MDNVDHMRLTRAEQTKLAAKLDTVNDWVADALDETLTRQTSHTAGPQVSIGRGKEQPLPFHVAASEVTWVLANTLSTWARSIAKARAFTDLPDRLTIRAAAAWLAESRHITGLALMDDGAQGFDEICYAIDCATRIVDRRIVATYLGPCLDDACDGELWAEPDEDPVACRTCKAATPRAKVENVIEFELRQRLCTAEELVDIVADRLGLTVKPKTIRELTRRRRPIAIRGVLPTGANLYHCGEVLDALIPRQRHRTRARLPTVAFTTRRNGV